MLGTPDFIAPKQILDARRADIRADIYGLGCTFYYLLTGHPPFEGASLYDVLQRTIRGKRWPVNLDRPEVPVELAALVAKMMAKEPDRRFQEPKEVAQALTPFFKKGDGAGYGGGAEVPWPDATRHDGPRPRTGLPPRRTGLFRAGGLFSRRSIAPAETSRAVSKWKSLIAPKGPEPETKPAAPITAPWRGDGRGYGQRSSRCQCSAS